MSEQAQPAAPVQYDGRPLPTPQTNTIQTGSGPQGPFVVITLRGPNGSWVTFMPPAEVEAYAQRLLQAAAHARSGLTMAASMEDVERAKKGIVGP